MKKGISILLAILVTISSFSIIGATATTIEKNITSTSTEKIKTEKKDSKGNTTYKIWSDKSYCLRLIESEFPYTFTNQINGKKITYPKSWGAVEYEYAHNTENNKNTTVWCIQPGVVINGDDYYFEDKGVNANYWKLLNNSKHKKIKKALSATFAYAKANGGTSKNSPYYYAALLLDWDYIQGIRNVTAPYSVKSGKKSNIYKIKNTYSKERTTAVQNAAKDIINLMNDEKKPLEKLLNNGSKNTRLYSSINGAGQAKSYRTNKKHNIQLPKTATDGKYTATSQAKFASLKTYKDEIKLAVVNHNGNNTDYINKHISVSLTTKGKIKVTSDVNLADRETNNGTTYYVRITKTPKGYTKGSDKVYQSKSNDKQTMVDMAYKADNTIAYFPIYQTKGTTIENYGSLIINKDITSTTEGFNGDALLGGWNFKLTNSNNNKVDILTTDEEGSTDTIENIPLNTTYTITELGLEIHPGDDNINDYYNVTTFNGKTYGMPNDIKDKTTNSTVNNVKTKKVTVTSYSSVTEVNWENEKEVNFKIRIRKKNSDGDDPSGYFFYVWDYGTFTYGPHDTFKKTIEKPQIVGPTDEEGYAEFKLDNISSVSLAHSQLILVELGKLKTGYSLPPTKYLDSWWDMVIDNETGTSKARERFKIPEKYKIVFEPAFHNATCLYDGVSLPIYRNDIKEFKNNPTNFTKEFTFVNEAEGKIKLKKKCAVTGKELGEAVYGIYEYGQGNPEDNYVGENGSGDEYYEEEEETQGVTEAISPTSTISDENIVTEPIVQDETDPIGEEGNSDVSNNTDDSAKLLDTITTKKGEWVYSKLLPCGTYYIQEIRTPNNKYFLDETKYTFTIQPGSNTDETALPITRTDEPTNINFYKTEKSTLSTNGGNVKGAHIKIYEKPASGTINYNTAKVITEFDTTATQKALTGIFERGKTYIAHETKTPDGYVTASDVEFTIPDKKDTSKEKVKMEDGTTNIEVYKKNADSSKNLSGCTLQVKDSNNNVVDSWVTTTSAHKIEGKLVVGKTYTLSETKPAPGYTTAKSISFTVKNTTAVQTVTMTDVQTSFEIYKKNANTSKNISGCVLEVRDSNKNVIDKWTTTTSAHKIVGKLVVGQKYTLVETKPATGYTTAKSIDFTVKDTTDVQTVTMEDVQTLIKVFKKNANNGRNLSGCKLAVKDKDNKIIESWTTTSSAHEIIGLTVGQTYTLYEVEPAPGYVKARDITFTVEDTSEAQEVTMNDEQTTVTVHKKNKDGSEYVGGCTLNIRNSQGNIVTVITNTSNTKAETIKGVLVVGETYTIEEIKSGDGYATTTNKTFTVLDTSENQDVYMYDDTIKVKFSKTTITGTEELEGCKLMLLEAQSGSIIDSWTSTNKPHMIEKRLVVGKSYILKETKPADGYVTATNVTFTVKDTGEIQTVEMKDDTTKVKVSKQDITNNQELAGCSLKIIDTTNDKVIEEWVSTTTPHMIEGKLVAGRKYILSEVKAVKGYATAEDVEFTVKDTGEIQTVEMKDEPIKVKLSKRVITGESELPGCELEVKDKDNKTIDSWTSTATPHIINKLTVGQSYKLIETKAVNGYATTESINFTIADTGEVQNVEPMRDDTTKVQISKVDIATKQELPDCELQLLDKTDNNKEIAKWISTNVPHYIEGQLVVGHTYTLVELRPAKGFTTAESIDFTVEDTAEIQKVQMIDGNTRVQFSKTDLTGEKEIPGCLLSLTDEADNKEIERWTTTDTPHLIEGKLVAGHTYILKELNPAKGYVTAANIKYKVKDTTALQVVEPMKDDVTKISFTKTDITGQKEIPNCKLELKDADSNIIESWTSTNKAHVITGKLEVGKSYILTEKYPSDGYATAKDVTFKVEDTGDIQPVNMKDEITKVSISKKTITGDDELAGCNLEVRNENNDLIDAWTSTNEQHLIKGLTINKTYTLSEAKPADGYTTATDISFTVNDTGDVQYITPMRDDTTKVKISKVDITNQQELVGCHLKIVDKTKDNEDVESWVSTDTPHYIEGKLVVGHTYTLIETKPADGFTTAESVDFTIKDSGEVQTVKMEDNKTKVAFSKTDITGEKEIAGCELKLTDKTDGDKEIAKWVSTETPHEIDGQLIVGHTYVLTETKPADGFVTAESVEITIEDTNEIQKAVMKDDTVKVELSKTDITGKKEIPDCKLKLIDKADNKEIDSWTSTDTPHYIEGKLVVGKTYILSETYPADGYATATDVEFTVDDKGSVQKVSMKDDTIKVALSKTDITGQKELPNCTLEVTDEEGFIVDNWVSTDTPHLIEGKLIAGKTYTLTERKPADGYATAEDIKFTVRDTGEIQNITPMKDDTIKCSFSKTDITGEKELAGCNLVLTDKADGKKIDSWTSSDTPHIIEGKLVAGKTYILSETKPADGYTTAENVEFTVSDTGKVQDVQMKDDTTKVQISKVDITGEKELAGCSLELTDNNTKKIVDQWVSADTPHYIEGKLIVGHEYTLKETNPAEGYVTASDVVFTVKDNNEIQKVQMKDGKTKVSFSKQSLTDSKEIEGCSLVVTDADNNSVIDEWISTTTPHIIEGELVAGKTYILTETNPAKGYVTAESVKFTVADTTNEQKVTMKDDVTKVEFSKTDITNSKEIKGCILEITDTDGNSLYSWTSGDKPHIIKGQLEINKSYYLIEKTPAKGYTTAEKVEFKVDDTGDIQHVEMKDAPTNIEIHKLASHDKSLLLGGANFKVYNKKHKSECYKFITTEGKPYSIIGKLKVGDTYVVEETKAPNGYKLAKTVTFKVKDTGEVQIVNMYDKKIKPVAPVTGNAANNFVWLAVLLGLVGVGFLIIPVKKKFFAK